MHLNERAMADFILPIYEATAMTKQLHLQGLQEVSAK
jgi:hypothetical protein